MTSEMNRAPEPAHCYFVKYGTTEPPRVYEVYMPDRERWSRELAGELFSYETLAKLRRKGVQFVSLVAGNDPNLMQLADFALSEFDDRPCENPE